MSHRSNLALIARVHCSFPGAYSSYPNYLAFGRCCTMSKQDALSLVYYKLQYFSHLKYWWLIVNANEVFIRNIKKNFFWLCLCLVVIYSWKATLQLINSEFTLWWDITPVLKRKMDLKSSFRCTIGDFYMALGSSKGLALWVSVGGGLLKRVLYFFGNEPSLGRKTLILQLPQNPWPCKSYNDLITEEKLTKTQ